MKSIQTSRVCSATTPNIPIGTVKVPLTGLCPEFFWFLLLSSHWWTKEVQYFPPSLLNLAQQMFSWNLTPGQLFWPIHNSRILMQPRSRWSASLILSLTFVGRGCWGGWSGVYPTSVKYCLSLTMTYQVWTRGQFSVMLPEHPVRPI